jgi:hypothetical protein
MNITTSPSFIAATPVPGGFNGLRKCRVGGEVAVLDGDIDLDAARPVLRLWRWQGRERIEGGP